MKKKERWRNGNIELLENYTLGLELYDLSIF